MLDTAAPVAGRLGSATRPARRRFAALDGRGGLLAGLIAFAGPLTFFVGALGLMRSPAVADVMELAAWWLAFGGLLWALLWIGGDLCERLTARLAPAARRAAWVLAALAAAVMTSTLTSGRATVLLAHGLVHDSRTMHLHGIVFAFGMALLYFAHLRRLRLQQSAAQRLVAAQAAQRDARRRIVEARLHEMQARIDPQLLFDMLAAVRRTYDSDTLSGERLLDQLIAFLRSALPRLRENSSSLAREIELARALVALLGLAAGRECTLNYHIAPAALHARFPPGVLLPLLHQAAACSASCAISAQRNGERIGVGLQLGRAPRDDAIARVRSLLAELFGADGTLEVDQGATTGIVNVIVALPYEPA